MADWLKSESACYAEGHMSLTEGEILDGKYRIIRQIGEGGMGAVFLGENLRVRKTVAIKVLHANAGGVEDAVQRFEREAQAAGQIGSDHIVEVHDLGRTPAGDHFMVMEFLDGESLRQRLKKGRAVEPEVVAPIVSQLLEGLGAAHAAGIIHRDLKPDNIYLVREKAGRKDFVKILDFGISKFLQIGGEGGAVTRTGMVMGSPNYMSPEQVKSSSEVDARSDLYTVGVILFEAVTGFVPFKANTFAELLFKIVYEPLPDPRSLNAQVDQSFASLVVKACASRREDRFQTAAEFKVALEPYLPRTGNRSVPAPENHQAFLAPPPRGVQGQAPLPLVQHPQGPLAPSPHLPPPHLPPPHLRPPPPAPEAPADQGGRTIALDLGSGGIDPSPLAHPHAPVTGPGYGAPGPQSGGQTAYLSQASQSGGFSAAASQSRNQGGGFNAVSSQSGNQGGGFNALANQSGSQSGGFNAALGQNGGFNGQANQSGSQSGGFNGQANQSGSQSGGFNGQANQSGGHAHPGTTTGGRFSSTFGASVGSVAFPRKKSLLPILLGTGAVLLLGLGTVGFLVTRGPPGGASSMGRQEAKPAAASPASTATPADSPSASAATASLTPEPAGTVMASSSSAAIAVPSATTATLARPVPAAPKGPVGPGSKPIVSKPDGSPKPEAKPGSDLLGY